MAMNGIEVCCQPEWLDALPETMALDNLMRCPICFDYINTAMMLPSCSHNYCSLCIRKYFQYKTQCPTCGMPASDPDLKNNRVLDSIVKQFLEFRKQIESCLKGKNPGQTPSDRNFKTSPVLAETGTNLSADKMSKYFTTSKTSPHKRAAIKCSNTKVHRDVACTIEIEISDEDGDDDFMVQDLKSNPGIRTCSDNIKTSIKSPAYNLATKHDHPIQAVQPFVDTEISAVQLANEETMNVQFDKLQNLSIENKQSGKSSGTPMKVACPVCGVPVKQCYVNIHLDRCLREDGQQKLTKRKPLTKVVYNLMSDKELKKKIRELGLSVQGDRQVLIKRHREFLMFYNADGDSLNPKPLSVLVQEFEKTEKMKNQMSKRSSKSVAAAKKDSKPEEIRKAQKQYAKNHNSQYSALMADVKKRMTSAKLTRHSARTRDTHDDETNTANIKSASPGLCSPDECNLLSERKFSQVQDSTVSNKPSKCSFVSPEIEVFPFEDDTVSNKTSKCCFLSPETEVFPFEDDTVSNKTSKCCFLSPEIKVFPFEENTNNPPSAENNSHSMTSSSYSRNECVKSESKNVEIDLKKHLNPHLSSTERDIHQNLSPRKRPGLPRSKLVCNSPQKTSRKERDEKIEIDSVDQLNTRTELSSSFKTKKLNISTECLDSSKTVLSRVEAPVLNKLSEGSDSLTPTSLCLTGNHSTKCLKDVKSENLLNGSEDGEELVTVELDTMNQISSKLKTSPYKMSSSPRKQLFCKRISQTKETNSPKQLIGKDGSQRNKLIGKDGSRNKLIMEDGSPRNKLIMEDGSPRNKLIMEDGYPRNKLIMEDDSPRNNLMMENGSPRNKMIMDGSPRNKLINVDGYPRNKLINVDGSPRNKLIMEDDSPRNKLIMEDGSPRNKLIMEDDSPRNKLITEDGSSRNKLVNNQGNKIVLIDSVDKCKASTLCSPSPVRSSPRKRLFSPNTAGIACSVLVPAATSASRAATRAACSQQLYVEDSDPEEPSAISFMDSIAESIDKFGSDSFLDKSPAACKDLWPALSQSSQSTPCDVLGQSGVGENGAPPSCDESRVAISQQQDGAPPSCDESRVAIRQQQDGAPPSCDESRVAIGQQQDGAPPSCDESRVAIGQQQDGSISSTESDILDSVNEVMQFTVDLGITTRRQKAKSRVSSVRRSARCRKRMSEHDTEDATPNRKKRK